MRIFPEGVSRFAFVGWALVILSLSLDPNPPGFESGLFSWDKFQHGAAFGILALLGGIGFRSRVRDPDLVWGYAFAVALLFGALVELAQGFLTAVRSADWKDLLADGIGAALACAVGRWGMMSRRRRH